MLEQTIELIEKQSPHLCDLIYVNSLKSGKEANVYLVKNQNQLFALKIYKQSQKYSTKSEYLLLDEIKSRTMRNAIKNKSRAGKRLLQQLWTYREAHLLDKLHGQGASVPKVYSFIDNAILMEFLGEGDKPAPRLVDTQLSKTEAYACFTSLCHNIKILIHNRVVHGDLSEFNILWFKQKPYIIDFPQFLNIDSNTNAEEKFLKDLENIKLYFQKNGVEGVEKVVDELYELFWRKKYYG